MKTIDLFPHESKALSEKRLGLIIRVVEPQPDWIESSGRWRYNIPKNLVRDGCCTSVCTASREWWEYLSEEQNPFGAPGEVLGCREGEWVNYPMAGDDGAPGVIFKWSGKVTDEMLAYLGVSWQASDKLPDHEIRFHVKVDGARCKRSCDLSETEMEQWRLNPNFNEESTWVWVCKLIP